MMSADEMIPNNIGCPWISVNPSNPRLDENVGFWLVNDPLVQNPYYRLVVTLRHWGSLRCYAWCKDGVKLKNVKALCIQHGERRTYSL